MSEYGLKTSSNSLMYATVMAKESRLTAEELDEVEYQEATIKPCCNGGDLSTSTVIQPLDTQDEDKKNEEHPYDFAEVVESVRSQGFRSADPGTVKFIDNFIASVRSDVPPSVGDMATQLKSLAGLLKEKTEAEHLPEKRYFMAQNGIELIAPLVTDENMEVRQGVWGVLNSMAFNSMEGSNAVAPFISEAFAQGIAVLDQEHHKFEHASSLFLITTTAKSKLARQNFVKCGGLAKYIQILKGCIGGPDTWKSMHCSLLVLLYSSYKDSRQVVLDFGALPMLKEVAMNPDAVGTHNYLRATTGYALLVDPEAADDHPLPKGGSICEMLVSLLKSANDQTMIFYSQDRSGQKFGFSWGIRLPVTGIGRLAIDTDNHAEMISHGVVDELSRAFLVVHPEREMQQSRICAVSLAVWNLSFSEQGKEALNANPDIISRLHAMKKIFADNAHIIKSIDGALFQLGNCGTKCDESQCCGEHVMISYSWEQQKFVLWLRNILKSRGFTVWTDVDEMSGSTLEAMAHAVESASALVVVASQDYRESSACRTEAEYAFQLKKPIIPVKVNKSFRPDGWLGALLGSKLYYTFDPKNYNEGGVAVENISKELSKYKSSSDEEEDASSNGKSAELRKAWKRVAAAETLAAKLEQELASVRLQNKELEKQQSTAVLVDQLLQRFDTLEKNISARMDSFNSRLLAVEP